MKVLNIQTQKFVILQKKTCEFAYDKFKGKEELYEDCEYEFEPKIENVALGIDSHLQKNPKNKKSAIIKTFDSKYNQ